MAYKTADLLFAAATAALAAGDPARARERVRQAHRLFRTQGRTLQEARASLVLAEARYAAGEHSAVLLHYAEEVAARLEASRAGEAMQARLLAGRIALSRGNMPIADQHLEHAARPRRRGPPLSRSVAWLARALQADARGTQGPPSPPARAGSMPWRSIRCGSGPPSCARTARPTVPSSRRWPSATRFVVATSAGCCSGASGGGRPRWSPGAHRSVETRS